MKALIATMTLLLLVQASDARIGETRDQCVARYGTSEKAGDPQIMLFKKSGFSIGVQFHDDKAEILLITKIETDVLDRPVAMTEVEIETILKANGGDKEWKVQGRPGTTRTWTTADGSLTAVYRSSENKLILITKEAADRADAEKAAKDKKNLEGF